MLASVASEEPCAVVGDTGSVVPAAVSSLGHGEAGAGVFVRVPVGNSCVML